jgi:hypothetical protein
MVREAELQAKRSRAGKLGADHTNLINKQLRDLSRQMTRQTTRQNSRAPPRPFLKERKITSTSFVAARASDEVVDNSVDSKPAEEKRSAEVRKPSDVSKSELDQLYAARRAGAPP